MKRIFRLSQMAQRRISLRNILFSGVFASGLSFPVLGEQLQYYDPDALKGLPSIANHNETYVFVDIDDDGDQDAFHQNVFFENIGSAAKPSYERKYHNNPLASLPNTKMEFVDIDDDGDLDVFIGSIKSGNREQGIRWYENIGSSSIAQYIQRGTDHLGGLHQNYARKLIFVDIDADGDQDVFLSVGDFYENIGTKNFPFFYQQEVSNFSALNTLMAESSAIPVFIDMDGDEDLDALFPRHEDEFTDLIYLENTGSAAKGSYRSSIVQSTLYGDKDAVGWQAVDIDNDLDVDLVINGIVVYNREAIEFDAFDFKRLKIPLGLSFSDLDGDADQDAFLVAVRSGKSSVYQYTNEGNMYFSQSLEPWSGQHISSPSLFSAQFVDLDQDGDLDQLMFAGSSIRFFENIGSAKSPDMAERTSADNPFFSLEWGEDILSQPAFVDIDFDDDLDMFVLARHSTEGSQVVFYENIGNMYTAVFEREFAEGSLLLAAIGIESFAFSDVDLDGDKDLLMTDSQELMFLENIGGKGERFILRDINSSPFKDVSIPNHINQLKFVDLDHNGHDDLIINDNLLYLTRVTHLDDSDYDGLPNDWEVEYGLDPYDGSDASIDSDHDGYSNLEEYHANTNPKSPIEYPGSSASDSCHGGSVSPVVIISNKHYSSTDIINCQASTAIALEENVSFSSGAQAFYNAPLIQLKPNVRVPYGSRVTFTSVASPSPK